MKKIFFLLNPSGRMKGWDLRHDLAAVAKRKGWTPRFAEIDRSRPQAGAEHIRQALDEKADRIAVVGGDGTIHRTLNNLHQLNAVSKIPIAIIPAGTCNDFARFLGLSKKKLHQAIEHSFSDHHFSIDVASLNGELFINNAGIGRQPIRGVMPKSPLQTLRSFKPLDTRARWDKGELHGKFFMGLVCNGPYFSAGLHFSKTSSLTDGRLDVTLLPVQSKRRLAWLLLKGRFGRQLVSRSMISLQVTELTLDLETPVWPQADGEIVSQPARRLHFALLPEKAIIVLP